MPRAANSLPDDVLVAGGTGFVGSHLVERLLRRGTTRVWILARRPPAIPARSRVVFLAHDLARPWGRLPLPSRIRTVFHCASPRSERARDAELRAANVAGTAALLRYAAQAGARRFVYVSSGGVTGYRRRPIAESTAPAPDSPYLRAKRAGERLVLASRVPACVVRLFFPYGPGQREGLMPLLCRRLESGEAIVVGAAGAPALNPIHVRDAARLLDRIGRAARPEPLMNLAGPEVSSVRDLALRLGRELGLRPVFRHGARRGHLVADTRRLVRAYGARRIGLDEGLAEFAAWWKDERA